MQGGGRTELVTNGNELIIAYDPATGKELWRTTGVQSNAIHTPLVGHGLVIVTAGYPAKKVIALRPGPAGRPARRLGVREGTGYVISNIVYGDYLYLFTDNGIVTCLDPKTGAVKYEGGRIPVPARFMGSPVAFAGLVAMTSEEGDTFMLKAGPTHEIVRTNSIDEPVYRLRRLPTGAFTSAATSICSRSESSDARPTRSHETRAARKPPLCRYGGVCCFSILPYIKPPTGPCCQVPA